MNARYALLATAVFGGLVSCSGSTPSSRPQREVAAPAISEASAASNGVEDLLAVARAHGLTVEAPTGANGDLPAREIEATIRQHLLNGVTPPTARPAAFAAQEDGVSTGDLQSLMPQHPEYEELKDWLGVYRAVAERGGWPSVPADPGVALHPGDQHPLVAQLRARLEASVDDDEARAASLGRVDSIYDADLDLAVRSAQSRFGLTVDGVVGKDTWAALAVPAERRADALASSMEWFRWLPRDFGKDLTLWVNVPTFELQAVAAYETRLEMPVVVGARRTPTVLLVDTLERVVTNPYWNVPTSIVVGELAPAQRANPDHLSNGGYEVVGPDGVVSASLLNWEQPDEWIGTYRIRQRPGPSNALGSIQFLFPNRDAIYMHDTPSKAAFERSFRAVSHGCVRLSDPWALAEFLFEHDVLASNPESARGIESPSTFDTQRTVPVVFTYLTARAGRGGGAPHFSAPLYEAVERAAPFAKADR